jgi:predicted aspartyl protease
LQDFGIVVQGGIGSVNNLNFLVDTGAVPSVLSERLASRIGVTGTPGAFALLDKDTTALYVTVDEVRLGSIRVHDLPMVVFDLARFERLLGIRIDAIIGLDVLARHSFSIDYKRRTITPGLSGLARHAVSVEIHGSSSAPYWVLPISLGDHNFRVLLDTGANNFTLFEGHAQNTTADSLLVNGVKETAAPRLRSSLLMIGDTPLKTQIVVAIKGAPLEVLREVDGVLGPTALGIARIEFDWENKCLRWDTE